MPRKEKKGYDHKIFAIFIREEDKSASKKIARRELIFLVMTLINFQHCFPKLITPLKYCRFKISSHKYRIDTRNCSIWTVLATLKSYAFLGTIPYGGYTIILSN